MRKLRSLVLSHTANLVTKQGPDISFLTLDWWAFPNTLTAVPSGSSIMSSIYMTMAVVAGLHFTKVHSWKYGKEMRERMDLC